MLRRRSPAWAMLSSAGLRSDSTSIATARTLSRAVGAITPSPGPHLDIAADAAADLKGWVDLFKSIRIGGPAAATPSPSVHRGLADEAALSIHAQRQMREREIAERIGALTPTRE